MYMPSCAEIWAFFGVSFDSKFAIIKQAKKIAILLNFTMEMSVF